MKFVNDSNLKEFILNNYNQIKLFSKYTGIDISEINHCISDRGYKTNNLLREDNTPSLGFQLFGRKVYMRDFAYYQYRGDIFTIVGSILGKSVNNKKQFIEICHHIIQNEKIVVSTGIIENEQQIKQEEEVKRFYCEYRSWNNTDIKYWKQYGLSTEFLQKNNVFPIESITLMNKHKIIYFYKNNDPCYEYHLDKLDGIQRHKFYFPNRKRKSKFPRFLTNNSFFLESLYELRPTENLLITKSRKDAIVLKNIFQNYIKYDISITNTNCESIVLTEKVVTFLQSKYKNIYLLFDFDNAGINTAKIMRDKYGFKLMFITDSKYHYNKTPIKDISDYVKYRGIKAATQLIQTYFKTIL